MINESIFKSIVENSPLACCVSKLALSEDGGRDYEIIQSNITFRKTIGLEGDLLEGQKISELRPNLKHNIELSKCFDEVTKDGKDKDYQKYYIKPETYCKIKVHFIDKDHFILYVSECKLDTSDLSSYMRSAEKIQQVFNNVETQIWNLIDTKTYGYVNKAHADFVGLKVKDMEFKDIYKFFKEDEANICVIGNETVFSNKKQVVANEWLKSAKGEDRLVKITKSPILNAENNVEMVICMAEDITERSNLESQKELKEDILYSMIAFTNELLTNRDYDSALFKGISKLGEATKVDRVYYWENHLDETDNKWYTSQRFEWTNDGVEPLVDNPELQNVPFEDVWDFVDILSKSEHFNYHVKDIENDFTKEFLEMQDVLSILVIPVIIEGVFRGFIGFDSCKNEKEWSNIDISLLDSFVLLYKKSIERYMLEEKMIKVKNNFDNFINTIPDLLIVLDLKGNIIFANQSVYDRLGYSKEELYGKSALVVHPQMLRKAALDIIRDMILGKKDYCPLPIITKDGELINVETRITRGLWNGQDVLFSVTKDVSELKMSEEKFYKAFNNSGISMFITTMEEGRFLEVNNTFLNIMGLNKEQIIGKTSKEIDFFSDPDQRSKILKLMGTDKRIAEKEFRIKGKDGKVLDGLFNIVPIHINKELCILSSMIDMAGQKLMIEKLSKAKEMSDIANTAKSEFLSHMSHEIRTPMNAVVAYSDLLLLTNLSLKQYSYIHGIKSSSKMLMSMINDTLDWGKIENTGLELEDITFSIDEILDNVVTQIKFKSIDNYLDIIIDKGESIPLIIGGDPLRLQQVLLNLLSNAVKFTEKGEIRVVLRLLNVNENKIELQFSVSDTGMGISEEDMDKIFEPFKQANNPLVYKNSGTGLGLSISKKIVHLMQGKLQVKSELGVGSTFFFNAVFNIRNQDYINPVNNYIKDFSEKIVKDFGKYKNIRVLVVDDNEINQDVLKEILENSEMQVTVVDSGKKAIEQTKTLSFDIVLLDLRMPEMDGYETIANIRDFLSYEQLPIIAVTASVSIEERKKTIVSGFNDYLIKPIDKNRLLELINNLTSENKRSEAQNPSQRSSNDNINYKNEFENINEIDSDKCLNNFGGDQKFLFRILKKFYDNHKDSVEEIRKAIQIEDFKTASRIAHTIKGVAGEIKAYEIYKLSAKIEEELIQDINVVDSLEKLEVKLHSLCDSIEKIDEESSESIDPAEVRLNSPKIAELLNKLEKLLLESDMDSEKIVQQLILLTKETVIGQKIMEIKNYCEQYDFDDALSVLEEVNAIISQEEQHVN